MHGSRARNNHRGVAASEMDSLASSSKPAGNGFPGRRSSDAVGAQVQNSRTSAGWTISTILPILPTRHTPRLGQLALRDARRQKAAGAPASATVVACCTRKSPLSWTRPATPIRLPWRQQGLVCPDASCFCGTRVTLVCPVTSITPVSQVSPAFNPSATLPPSNTVLTLASSQ